MKTKVCGCDIILVLQFHILTDIFLCFEIVVPLVTLQLVTGKEINVGLLQVQRSVFNVF